MSDTDVYFTGSPSSKAVSWRSVAMLLTLVFHPLLETHEENHSIFHRKL